MSKPIFLIFLWLHLLFPLMSGRCQNPSYQTILDSSGLYGRDLLVNENNEIVGLYNKVLLFDLFMYIVNYTGNGQGIKQAKKINIDGPPQMQFRFFNRSSYHQGNKIYWVQNFAFSSTSSAVISMDKITGDYWLKGLKHELIDFSIAENTGNLVVAIPAADTLALLALDSQSGNELWHKAFILNESSISSLAIQNARIQSHTSGDFFISGVLAEFGLTSEGKSFVLKMDEAGNPIVWKNFETGYSFDQLYVSDEAVYVLGKSKLSFPFTANEENLVLAKLGLNLTPIWTKVFYAEEFEFNNATLSIAPDGSLKLGYSTFGYFPTILAKLDAQGQILWEKGYPLYQPQLDALSDGSLLMNSNFLDGNWKNVIAKTDTLGDIEGCETFPTCLESADIALSTGSFDIEATQMVFDTNAVPGLIVEPVEFSFSDFCDIPPVPIPDFIAPDTVCIMDSITTIASGNELAHGTLWELIGNGVDSTWADLLSFRYRFTQPGNFNLSQTIWYLGCSHTEVRNITVLPPLQAEVFSDGDFCKPPSILQVQSNRPLLDITWTTGEDTPEIQVLQDGNYSATVSDGYCSVTDSTSISFLFNQLNGESPLILPPDTLICQEDFPYALSPTSDFANEFSLNHGAFQGVPIVIGSEGEHVITVSIEGCLFSDSFFLDVHNCEPTIYFPDVFSPNGDGINDVFFPQGINFISSKLMIFDRWGGLVHLSEGADATWEIKGAIPGVYIYAFDYIIPKTSKEERIYGTITLVK